MVDDSFDDLEIPDWLRRPVTPPAKPSPAEAPPAPAAPPSGGPALSESRPDELPDWFAELGIEEGAAAPPGGGSGAPALVMDQPTPLVDELRQQVRVQDVAAVPSRRRRGGLGGILLGLAPWQRLTLAVLLFLDVVLLGCMCLVMAGRVVPFR